MRIISKRAIFDTDHSSQTYDYFSEKKLSDKDLQDLKNKAPHYAKFTRHYMKIHVYGEGYPSIVSDSNITAQYFTCFISEDYDWINCEIVLDYNESIFNDIKKYNSDDNDHTLSIKKVGDKLLISAYVHVDYGAFKSANIFKELRELFLDIRQNVFNKNYEELKILSMYCEDEKSIKNFNAQSEQSKALIKVLEENWL